MKNHLIRRLLLIVSLGLGAAVLVSAQDDRRGRHERRTDNQPQTQTQSQPKHDDQQQRQAEAQRRNRDHPSREEGRSAREPR